MNNFYTDFLLKSPLFNSSSRVSSLDYLEPVLREKIEYLLEDAAQAGTPLLTFETYRSQARQEALFQQGATQLRTVGVHNFGLAIDLVKNIHGEPSWKGDFRFLRDLARKYDLVSGLDWGFPNVKHGWIDACHVQRCAVIDQPRLFDGSWYPDEHYSAYGNA